MTVCAEAVLPEPPGGVVRPIDFRKSYWISPIPQMNANRGIRRGGVAASAGNWTVCVLAIAIKRSVPTCLQTNDGVIHGYQVKIADRTTSPLIRGVVADLLANDVVLIDVENVPLAIRQLMRE